MNKGLSKKDVRSQGGRVLSSANILWIRGKGLQMRTFAIFGARNFGLFEIYGVRADKREGVEPVRTFYGKFFGILCGRFLWNNL